MKLVLFLLIVVNTFTYGQSISYNFDTNNLNTDYHEALSVLEGYLNSNPQNQEKNTYWNTAVQQENITFDFLENEFEPSLYMGYPIHILSIKKKENHYTIKVQFSYCNPDNSPNILAIVNYVVIEQNGTFKLYNALTINRKKWDCTTVGFVDFYYPKSHKFNHEKALKLNDFIISTCKNFNVNPNTIEYYLDEDFDNIQQLKGIDYYLGMNGDNTPKGKASGNKVYCGGLGEYYTHEVFHALIDHNYTNSHFWASEGIATFLCGSRGQSLSWHITQANTYFKLHKDIDLNEILTLKNIDNITSYHYVIGGLIAKKIFEKGGWKLLIQLLNSGKTNTDYYKAINTYLGIKKENLNIYLRQQLDIEANI